MKISKIVIIGIILGLVCLCIGPVSATGLDTYSNNEIDGLNPPNISLKTTSQNGLQYPCTIYIRYGDNIISFDVENVDDFADKMKVKIRDICQNEFYDAVIDRSSWGNEEFTKLALGICNNTNCTPDERLRQECFAFGWDSRLEEFRTYKDNLDNAVREARMEAERKGETFDEDAFIAEYLLTHPRGVDDPIDIDVGESVFSQYLQIYFDNYQVTGDYGRENPDPF